MPLLHTFGDNTPPPPPSPMRGTSYVSILAWESCSCVLVPVNFCTIGPDKIPHTVVFHTAAVEDMSIREGNVVPAAHSTSLRPTKDFAQVKNT